MGLDMYAYRTKNQINESVDFSAGDFQTEELHYWRKHPNLHGWMEDLYRSKGGQADSFNCVNVELDEHDLLDLKSVIISGNLPETGGFFFGRTDGTEYADDLEFVDAALESIKEGYSVFYTSWW
jgi:hypothetical protein